MAFMMCDCWPFNRLVNKNKFERVDRDEDEFAPITKSGAPSEYQVAYEEPDEPGDERSPSVKPVNKSPELTCEMGNLNNGPADLQLDELPTDSDSGDRRKRRQPPNELTDMDCNSGDESAYPLSEDPFTGEYRRSRGGGSSSRREKQGMNRPIPMLNPPPQRRRLPRGNHMDTTEEEFSMDDSPRIRKAQSLRNLRGVNELFTTEDMRRAHTDGEYATRSGLKPRIKPDGSPRWGDVSKAGNWRAMMSDTDIDAGGLSEVPNHPILEERRTMI